MWKLEKHVSPSCFGTSLSWCWWPKKKAKTNVVHLLLPSSSLDFISCPKVTGPELGAPPPPPPPATTTTTTATTTTTPTTTPSTCSTRLCPCFFLRACKVKLLLLLTPMSMVGMLLDGCYLGWMVPTWRIIPWLVSGWKHHGDRKSHKWS